MLALVVSAEVHFSLETLRADLATERLEACVFAAVCDEVGTLAERLATHLALVRFLTCSSH